MSTMTQSFQSLDSPGVLVASPNEDLRKQLMKTLQSECWPVVEASGGADALDKLETSECNVLLLDQQLPDLNVQELVAMIDLQFPGVDVLFLDSRTGEATASSALRTSSGAHLLKALNHLDDGSSGKQVKAGDALGESLPGILGTSAAIERVFHMTRLVAPRNTTVLLTGESGSGKELFAEAIHKLSPRADRPFVVINCAAIPEALLESELFGYVRGAFTGAVQSRVGRLHAAHGGTLFLDEIGELPLGLQAKLLRFLENGEVQRLGSADLFRVDVRVIGATNADLRSKVRNREFREDLYYRLAVFPIELPPLRERGSDILLLAEHFLRELSSKPTRLSGQARDILLRHSWRGNIRELKHVVERASILAEDASVIDSQHIVLFDEVPVGCS